jgi:hypothetical protein
MLVITKDYTYKWDVKVSFPTAPGNFEEQTFTVTFRRPTKSEVDSLVNGDGKTDNDFVAAVVVGWEGIVDDQKQELPFTPENLKAVLDVPGVASAIVWAFMDSFKGTAQRKN